MISLKQRPHGKYDVWLDGKKIGRVWRFKKGWRRSGLSSVFKTRRKAIHSLYWEVHYFRT